MSGILQELLPSRLPYTNAGAISNSGNKYFTNQKAKIVKMNFSIVNNSNASVTFPIPNSSNTSNNSNTLNTSNTSNNSNISNTSNTSNTSNNSNISNTSNFNDVLSQQKNYSKYNKLN